MFETSGWEGAKMEPDLPQWAQTAIQVMPPKDTDPFLG